LTNLKIMRMHHRCFLTMVQVLVEVPVFSLLQKIRPVLLLLITGSWRALAHTCNPCIFMALGLFCLNHVHHVHTMATSAMCMILPHLCMHLETICGPQLCM
jgi:hypothetical protein